MKICELNFRLFMVSYHKLPLNLLSPFLPLGASYIIQKTLKYFYEILGLKFYLLSLKQKLENWAFPRAFFELFLTFRELKAFQFKVLHISIV